MTDRIQALTVTLADDVRADDLEPLMTAIALLKGVLEVAPVVVDVSAHVARQRAEATLRTRVLGFLQSPLGDSSG